MNKNLVTIECEVCELKLNVSRSWYNDTMAYTGPMTCPICGGDMYENA